MRVLTARGSELEREFPFGVVRQLFEPPLTDGEARERWLAGAAAPARAIFEAPDSNSNGMATDATFAALHGLYWLTANVAADGPLLLSVDDLHWCDRPSLRFLAVEGELALYGINVPQARRSPAPRVTSA